MVLSGAGVQHVRADDPVFDPVADQEIVDPPAAVVDLAGFDPLGPPGVGAGDIPVDMAEAVGQTDAQQIGKSLSFFIGEAGGHVVVLRMSQVDLRM